MFGALVKWTAKYISQRVFRETQWNKFGIEDPYYEEYEIEQRSFFSNKTRTKKAKREKPIPFGLSDNDSQVLRKVVRRAYHLDMLFNIFGYRIGWNGLVSIVPVVGDLASIILSLFVYKVAREVDGGLPLILHFQILGNIALDFLVGLIPVVGSIVEILYKANSRNALLLEKHLEEKALQNQAANTSALSDISTVVDDDSESLLDTTVASTGTKVAPSKVRRQSENKSPGSLKYRTNVSPAVTDSHTRTLSR